MQNITTIKTSSDIQYEIFSLGNKVTIEKPEEHQSLIDELGLVGQKKMILDQNDNIIPFLKMNITDVRVWKEYLPEKTTLEEYEAGLIPYEVLELLAMCKQKKYFTDGSKTKRPGESKRYDKVFGSIEIWDRPKDQIDPIAVGVLNKKWQEEGDSSWYGEDAQYFLLARWGHELENFSNIVQAAKNNWKQFRKNKLEDFLNTLNSNCDKYFAGEYVESAIYF